MKKIQLIITSLIFLLLIAAPSVWAAYSEYGPEARQQAIQGNVSLTYSTDNFLYTFMDSLRCTLGTGICVPNQQAGLAPNSLLGMVITQGIGPAYAFRPASTASFFNDLAANAGIVRPAYAQGIGFRGLEPIIHIWKAFRNIAYGFLIIIMVVIGFMVLFRWQIDPRTVVTIQNALPRIIVTLILITFSYAIVGILIDAMYLITFLAMFSLGKIDGDLFSQFSGGSLTHLIGTVFVTGIRSIDDIARFLGLGFDSGVTATTIGAIVGGVIGAITPLTPVGGAAIGGAAAFALPTVIIAVVIGILLFIMMIRIFLLLLTSWIAVILSLIFSPLQLMFGAIPGVDTFGGWFRNLIANLAVFPIVVILLLLGAMLSGIEYQTPLWKPPGLGGATGQGVPGLIGLGIIMVIPAVINGVKQLLKAQPPIPAGPGAILSPLSGALGTGMQALSSQYYISAGPVGGLIRRFGGPLGKLFPDPQHR